ncbi:hypothetical protein TrCOL_g2942 [Triparma columacea]|uniref:Uncharacterized protein n=1 Tax=Triparma columacea TaxID=722753 RepID=A0A9W7GM54_9STRA|nr:hypothetical protein TrCOL_g2942 [Triparma columacea]
MKQAPSPTTLFINKKRRALSPTTLFINKKRREELGMEDDDFEYDLDQALNNNTDPFITKVIAGSLILVIFALLVVGVIIPLTAPIEGGLCSPIQNGGRC